MLHKSCRAAAKCKGILKAGCKEILTKTRLPFNEVFSAVFANSNFELGL
jgi:hypothetical protein